MPHSRKTVGLFYATEASKVFCFYWFYRTQNRPLYYYSQHLDMLSHRRGDSRIARHCVGTGVPDGPSQIRSIDKTEDSTMTRTTIIHYFILPTSQQKVKKKRPGAHDSETPCRSIQYVKKKNHAEAWFSVFALPIFTGSDASAACGGSSEGAACAAVSKMQARFVRRRICRAQQRKQVYPPVPISLGKEKTSTRKWRFLCSRYLFSRPVTRQLSSAYMCLTSVFGMGTGGPT